MKNKIIIQLVIISITFLLLPIILAEKNFEEKSDWRLNGDSRPDLKRHNSGWQDAREQIVAELEKSETKVSGQKALGGIISHHLPTALPLIADFYKSLKVANDKIERFIILGPDHSEKCASHIAATDISFLTPFGELPTDKKAVAKFLSAGATIDNDCFDGEHAIGAQTVFIKYLYPMAAVAPLIFSSATKEGETEGLTKAIKDLMADGDTFVVASLDFSHYQNKELADSLDKESANMILQLVASGFDLTHVDSPPVSKLIISWARDNNLTPVILARHNSSFYNGQTENTTGYISAIFAEKLYEN